MSRTLRIFSSPRPTTVETIQKTFQNRLLLQGVPKLDVRAVGLLAKAQQLYGAEIHGFVMLGNHWHLCATFRDPEQMARLHRFFVGNLAKEVNALRDDWAGTVFPERYRHVELSEEPEVQLGRMKYLLSQGCKEGLVSSPLDWPGASSVESLVGDAPLRGEWVDRTAFRRARERGESVTEADFTEILEVSLSPVPSLAHLSMSQYRDEMRGLVRQIEQETQAMHRLQGTRPLGVEKLRRMEEPGPRASEERRPRPWFHAVDPAVRQGMRTALIYIAAAYRDAAGRLRGGDRSARFPVHTFPPGLPFVRWDGEGSTLKDPTNGLAPPGTAGFSGAG